MLETGKERPGFELQVWLEKQQHKWEVPEVFPLSPLVCRCKGLFVPSAPRNVSQSSTKCRRLGKSKGNGGSYSTLVQIYGQNQEKSNRLSLADLREKFEVKMMEKHQKRQA